MSNNAEKSNKTLEYIVYTVGCLLLWLILLTLNFLTIPVFSDIYNNAGANLGSITLILLYTSDFLSKNIINGLIYTLLASIFLSVIVLCIKMKSDKLTFIVRMVCFLVIYFVILASSSAFLYLPLFDMHKIIR